MKTESEIKKVWLLWKQVYDTELDNDDIMSNELKRKAKNMMEFLEWVLS